MKKLIAAAVLALAFPAASVFAANADAKNMAAAKELMAVMNVRAIMQASVQQMSQHMPDMMRQIAEAGFENKKFSEEQKRKARADLDKALPGMITAMGKTLSDPKLLEELEAETTGIYARNFSDDEMRQITAFYRSPVGTKMLSTMPKLMQESMMVSQKVIVPRIAKMVEGMTAATAK
ncbi:DUF2059 domain-containing protein [Duganella sp. FT92W]|uniref:DUF2059 domain-containing protein n=1 Tax=Pseudoduganella rivuli TaxID=2666085 RepID=A0A7X2IQI2_9BURK|nr:DUF2059 domain-containing protein [Pseudoduganella rivuli]MRV74075.1 DUF2059 domain-containing protein [Pseudoduganella rivuli]